MPDDNRFAGLSTGLEKDDPEEEEEAADRATGDVDSADEAETTSADTAVSESTDESDVTDGVNEADTADAPGAATSADGADEGGPAFEFDATTAKSIYVREETLALLEDTEFEVEMHLRRNHGIRDVTGREFHDAAVHVLEDHVDEVVEAVLAARDGEK